MIKVYENGSLFYEENKDFLLKNPHAEVFFRLDSPLLTTVDKNEFAIAAIEENKRLLVLTKEPYNTLYCGDIELVDELMNYLIQEGYKIKDYLSPSTLGDAILHKLSASGYSFLLSIGMDLLEAKTKYMISNPIVEVAKESDLDELAQMTAEFYLDCGLKDQVYKEKILETIENYRIIRKDNEIAAMAKMARGTEDSIHITSVYTKNRYRGLGYAKIICSNLLNEIIDMGKYAALNVDQKNPISYHIYSSIGFTKVFSQGIYIKQENK